ncbi:D-alanyl-D-alanine carboxypeptidase [Sedimentibacter acidaminivorans]|uniref:D-alanyl-D-alanine carboxypeptidase n=1 Tax=Sedimentibacter acidaminivorans TaxID=913099 RepID=A0ABS4GCI7_9FIRM|nr:D-alanyl-D-alanine carboxypeptidase [Sedimentibacter acidaminivorans]
MKQKIFKILIITLLLNIINIEFTFAQAIPQIWAESYIAIDANSGRIIGSKNSNQKLPMASTTKIMTSILAIDKIKDLDNEVEIPESCTNIEGSSLYLKPKQRVKILDLLYGTMLRSGNDAALALANIAGKNDSDKFITMMNDKAKDLGAFNTNFVNPNGLHDNNHYTTAYDLALISKYAMKNNLFREIVSAKNYKADSLNNVLYNKNKVVFQYEYGSGIKIGYTKAAGRCLVASAKKDEVEIIVVVLNDNNWFDDSYKLFDWAFENYNSYNIIEKGQYICDSDNGDHIFAENSFSYLLTNEEKDKIRFETNITVPHILNGMDTISYGVYNIYFGDNIIFTGNLIGNK